MKFRIHFIGLVLGGVVLFGCGETRDVGAKSKNERKDSNVNSESREDSLIERQAIVEFNRSDPQNYLLTFTGKDVKKQNRVLDIREINPYKSLPYPIRNISEKKLQFGYDFSNSSFAEKEIILKGTRINSDAYRKDSSYLTAYVKLPIVEAEGNIVAISYHISYYCNDEDILATQGVTVIYNEMGVEIQRIKDEKDGFYRIHLSDDGKYLVQEYGTDYGEDGGGQMERGIKIYETNTGKQIYEKDLGRDQFYNYTDFLTNSLCFYSRNEDEKFEYFVIDFINDETYLLVMDMYKYANSNEYRGNQLLNFKKSENVNDLLKDGFIKINK